MEDVVNEDMFEKEIDVDINSKIINIKWETFLTNNRNKLRFLKVAKCSSHSNIIQNYCMNAYVIRFIQL